MGYYLCSKLAVEPSIPTDTTPIDDQQEEANEQETQDNNSVPAEPEKQPEDDEIVPTP